jgi:tripartite-type tricarboxylate transporter receptor subunit TctC
VLSRTRRLLNNSLNLDIEPVTSRSEEFSTLIKTDMEKWAKLIKAAKIPVD